MRTNTVARTGHRGAAQARRLIAASRTPAQFILNTTIEDLQVEKAVQRCRAQIGFICGSVVILPGDVFYLVASPKFAHRFYVVTKRNGAWQCSSREAACAQRCIGQVENVRRAARKLVA